MSSSADHDEVIDYIEDKSPHEDETLFIPAPEGRPDRWTVFYTGILTGIAGGGIIPLSSWLGGLMVFLGYGMTVFSFARPRSQFGSALRFGFGVASLLAGLFLGCMAMFPEGAERALEIAFKRHVVFPGVALFPWVVAGMRYGYVLFSPNKVRRRHAA